MKIFISHSSVDKKFVRTLKRDLNENGIATWVDEDQLDFGDSLIDKLDAGLSESTHFVLILSQASVDSEWVKFELKKALDNRSLNLINKIIPIKYNPCEIPETLNAILHGDLSAESRIIKDDHVEFNDNGGYKNVVDKLCRSIRKPESQLTTKEISDIKIEITQTEKLISETEKKEIIRCVYKINGYSNKTTRLFYSERANFQGLDVELIKPILLPPLWRYVMPDLKMGETITIAKNFFSLEKGHFAGYRKDDTAITVDGRIRKSLGLVTGNKYQIEYTISNRNINFIGQS